MTTSFSCSCIASLLGLSIIAYFIPNFTIYILEYVYDLCIYRASLVAQLVKSLPTIQESQVQSLGQEDAQEKEMETCSSISAWRIPWREEPCGLSSMGSQRDTMEWLTLHIHLWKLYNILSSRDLAEGWGLGSFLIHQIGDE